MNTNWELGLICGNVSGSCQNQDSEEGLKGHHREILYSLDGGFPYKQAHRGGGCDHSDKTVEKQDCWVSIPFIWVARTLR